MIQNEPAATPASADAARPAQTTAGEVPCVVVGAGPGGLTAAYELSSRGVPAVVFEKDQVVGGISRTAVHQGYRFDIGGHRFFSKVPLIERLWTEILGDDLLVRRRLSRIYYDGKFFDYPLKPLNALRGLGPLEAARVGLSYLRARLFPHREERNFEQWVSNRFGHRLYEIFFKTYTEKVWGMPCSEISADWAAQRIKNLDLVKAVKNALLGAAGNREVITTLIDEFRYPRHGPGMMWERCRAELEGRGIATECGVKVTRLVRDGRRLRAVEVRRRVDGVEEVDEVAAGEVISTMPLGELVRVIEPPPPPEVLEAAAKLRHRDFLTVVLIVDRARLFPDNWIYIHSSDVRVGRVQNFKNWSPEMVPDPAKTAVGLEYFVLENDDLWSAADDDLVELGKREMAILGLIDPEDVEGGCVVRMPKAYPVYDGDYQEAVAVVRAFVDRIENLQTVGRNGQHRYNNQDHSMLTGIYAARNVASRRSGDGAGAVYDVWDVNVEQEYHEEVGRDRAAAGDRLVPAPATGPSLEEMVREAFLPYDGVAMGVAVGTVLAVGLALATAVLLFSGEPYGPNLSLLGNYFLGYEVSWAGLVVGSVEAAVGGYALGWLIARAVNRLVRAYETSVRRQLQLSEIFDPLVVE